MMYLLAPIILLPVGRGGPMSFPQFLIVMAVSFVVVAYGWCLMMAISCSMDANASYGVEKDRVSARRYWSAIPIAPLFLIAEIYRLRKSVMGKR